MKTVMIVDDELPSRQLLMMACDWNALGYKILCEARNGKEALELYDIHKPDLVFTDIQMPVMDGLELIKAIRVRNSQQKIIILSCHEDFAYAKQALKLGVLDYLIKDALTEDVLFNMLSSMSEQPGDPGSKSSGGPNGGSSENPEYGSSSPQNIRVMDNLLYHMMQDKITPAQVAELMEKPLSTDGEFFCVAVKPEWSAGKMPQQTSLICEKIRTVLRAAEGGDVCQTSNNTFFALAFLSASYSKMMLFNKRYSLIQLIRNSLEEILDCPLTIGSSNCSKSPFAVRQMIEEAQQALDSRMFYGKGKTLYYQNEHSRTHAVQIEVLNLRIEKIKAAIGNLNTEQLGQEISTLYEKDIRGIMQYNYVQYINSLLLGHLTMRCSSENIGYDIVFDCGRISIDELERLETVQEMCDWFIERFSRLLNEIRKRTSKDRSPRQHRILLYIQENYTFDINLDTIADHFGLHKVYLAKTFKDEFGESINEYIRKLRIEKAKELLCNEEVHVSDIVDVVGFNNPQSFYTIFKRFVGMSPGEYREQQVAIKHRRIS